MSSLSSAESEVKKDSQQASKKSEKAASNPDYESKSERSNVPMNIDPDEAKFAHSGGKSEHVMVNFTSKRMAVKVRCGNPNYRVEPTHLIIEPNKCRQLNITRLPGPIQTDKVVVQYLECDEKATDAKLVLRMQKLPAPRSPILRLS